MLNSDVNVLRNYAMAYSFINNNADGMLSDVKNTSGTSMIGLKWHALLEGTISLDVNNITSFVDTVEC